MDPIIFAEGDTKTFESTTKEAMVKPIKHYEKELSAIRTGRASTSLVENIMVECYGENIRLKELATLTAPEAQLITIQPWDKGVINEIEKALLVSDVGITPINDGTLIRLQLPQMSEDRRKEIGKLLGKKTEECKIGVRNIRKELHNQLRDAEKKHLISEDFAKRLSDLLQKITDSVMLQVDQLHDKKENEIKFV